MTLPTYLASHRGRVNRNLSLGVAALIFVFLSVYAAAQFASAGKSLQALLSWDYDTGTYLSACLIFLYCFAGGIRASIWTDVAQALIMLLGMYALVALSLQAAGGAMGLLSNLAAIDPQLAQFFPHAGGPFLLLLTSLVVSGIGVLGQPHVMVRSMAIKDPERMQLVRRLYLYLGYTLSLGAFLVGLAARILHPEVGLMDAEMIMPKLAMELFHPVAAGFLLAALFASTLSTADSQILVCASAFFSKDYLADAKHYLPLKLATFVTVVFTLIVALYFSNVFQLVMFSWSVLASSLTLLLVIKTLWGRPPLATCWAMLISGGSVAVLWRVLGWNSWAYESLPGILASAVPLLLWSRGRVPKPREDKARGGESRSAHAGA